MKNKKYQMETLSQKWMKRPLYNIEKLDSLDRKVFELGLFCEIYVFFVSGFQHISIYMFFCWIILEMIEIK